MGNCELREKETRVFIRAYSALEKKVRRVRPLWIRAGWFETSPYNTSFEILVASYEF
jgi:hypothetical protein